jgi:hypothetical protein
MKLGNQSNRAHAVLFLILFGIVGAFFLAKLGIPALEGLVSFQFYADSGTYHKLANGEFGELGSISEMITLSANYLGPLLILKLAQQNYYAVLCLNILIFWISVELLLRAVNASRDILYVVLLANPVTVSSLLAVNKEIISLLALALLIYGLAKKQWPTLIVAMAFGLLVRWQFLVFELIVIFAYSRWNIFSNRRRIFIALLLLAASIAIWQMNALIASVRGFDLVLQKYEGSGFFIQLVEAQKHGFYWLAFIPKAMHLLFGLGLRVDRLFDPTNLYNDVWQLLHSSALLILFCALLVRRQMRMQSDLAYVSIIYLVVFAVTPIYVPRYFYPVYILWAVLLASDGVAGLLPTRKPVLTLFKRKGEDVSVPCKSEGAL